MLDQDLKTQLTQVFAPLESTIEFSVSKSLHADQAQLLQLLADVASTHPKLKVVEQNREAPFPQFQLLKNGADSGIEFFGIPTGHEFTSLVVAILNLDLKGRLPDEALTRRIQRLKGPIHLRTFISLTCENCPDVVQALNQMAILHPNFKHTMVDGAYTQEEISSLGIQGVPSVIVGSGPTTKLIHSGRIGFLELLTKLENHFGTQTTENLTHTQHDLGTYDVVVIGGGPAGASAAIYSARKGLKTAILAETFGGQLQQTKGIENLIGTLYTEGPQLASQLQQHIQSYPITLFEHRRVQSISKDSVKTIDLESGETLQTKTVIIATGAKWRELGIPGEKEHIGRGVAFCPHCDGPYYKGKKVAVIGGGNSGVEAAIDLAGIVREVVLFEYNDKLKADQVLIEKLQRLPNAAIVTNAKTQQIIGDGQKVIRMEYIDRASQKTLSIDLDGVFVQIGLLPNSQFLKDTLELTPFGEIVVDAKGRTSAPGIYAAGDVTTTPYKQIIIAMGEGAKVALTAFEDKMRESPA